MTEPRVTAATAEILAAVEVTLCPRCKGRKGFMDTTYDRTGAWEWCVTCNGVGVALGWKPELLKKLRGPKPED